MSRTSERGNQHTRWLSYKCLGKGHVNIVPFTDAMVTWLHLRTDTMADLAAMQAIIGTQDFKSMVPRLMKQCLQTVMCCVHPFCTRVCKFNDPTICLVYMPSTCYPTATRLPVAFNISSSVF